MKATACQQIGVLLQHICISPLAFWIYAGQACLLLSLRYKRVVATRRIWQLWLHYGGYAGSSSHWQEHDVEPTAPNASGKKSEAQVKDCNHGDAPAGRAGSMQQFDDSVLEERISSGLLASLDAHEVSPTTVTNACLHACCLCMLSTNCT